jgi:hypothetical protein
MLLSLKKIFLCSSVMLSFTIGAHQGYAAGKSNFLNQIKAKRGTPAAVSTPSLNPAVNDFGAEDDINDATARARKNWSSLRGHIKEYAKNISLYTESDVVVIDTWKKRIGLIAFKEVHPRENSEPVATFELTNIKDAYSKLFTAFTNSYLEDPATNNKIHPFVLYMQLNRKTKHALELIMSEQISKQSRDFISKQIIALNQSNNQMSEATPTVPAQKKLPAGAAQAPTGYTNLMDSLAAKLELKKQKAAASASLAAPASGPERPDAVATTPQHQASFGQNSLRPAATTARPHVLTQQPYVPKASAQPWVPPQTTTAEPQASADPAYQSFAERKAAAKERDVAAAREKAAADAIAAERAAATAARKKF